MDRIMHSQDIAAALRRTPLFSGLSDEDLLSVSALAVPRHLPKGKAVFHEGERVEGFFVVVSGTVKVFRLSEGGKEQILHFIEGGNTFAEAALFEGGVFPAAAETLSECRLVFLPKRPFVSLLERNPRLSLRMLASLSRWLRRLADLADALSLRDVEARFTRYVAEDLRERGVTPSPGAVYELPVGKAVLASRLGTVPETFSRTLKKLQDEGVIDVRGKRIRLLDPRPFSTSRER
jgi:CRP/FNR family transcriptional regulator